MENICPMCGRKRDTTDWDSKIPEDPLIIKNQVTNVDRVLSALQVRDESILTLIEEREEMCPMCYELMEGIVAGSDREELENRLNEQVAELEETMEDRVQGQE